MGIVDSLYVHETYNFTRMKFLNKKRKFSGD